MKTQGDDIKHRLDELFQSMPLPTMETQGDDIKHRITDLLAKVKQFQSDQETALSSFETSTSLETLRSSVQSLESEIKQNPLQLPMQMKNKVQNIKIILDLFSPQEASAVESPQITGSSLLLSFPQMELVGQSVTLIKSTGTSRVYLIATMLASALAAFGIAYFPRLHPLYMLAGTIGMILVILIINKPEYGAYLLLLAMITNLSDILTEKGHPGITIPLVVVTLISVVLNQILNMGIIGDLFKPTRVEWALLSYYVIVLLSFFVASDKTLAYKAILSLSKNFIVLYCIVITLNTTQKWRKSIWILMVIVTILSFLGLYQEITGNTTQIFWGFAKRSLIGQVAEDNTLRYSGPIGEANIWGQILVMILPITLYRIFYEKKILSKLFCVFASVVIFTAMVFTNSRGAFLSLIVLLPLTMIIFRDRFPQLLLAALIGGVVLTTLPATYTHRLETLKIFFNLGQEYAINQDESFSGRLNNMITGLSMVRSHPLLGVGIGNFGANYWEYATDLGLEAGASDLRGSAYQKNPHSLYVEILAETGMLGFVTFMAFFGFMIFSLWDKYKEATLKKLGDLPTWYVPVIVSLLTYLVSAVFLHGILFRYFMSILAIGIIGTRLDLPNQDSQLSQ